MNHEACARKGGTADGCHDNDNLKPVQGTATDPISDMAKHYHSNHCRCKGHHVEHKARIGLAVKLAMSVVDEVQRRRDNRNSNEGPTRSQESEKGDKIDTKTEADSVQDFGYSVISSLSFLRRDIVSSGLGIWLLMPKIGGAVSH